MTPGCCTTRDPTTKNVAGTCARRRTRTSRGVKRGSGPSSNVRRSVFRGTVPVEITCPWFRRSSGERRWALVAAAAPDAVALRPLLSTVNPWRSTSASSVQKKNPSSHQCAGGRRIRRRKRASDCSPRAGCGRRLRAAPTCGIRWSDLRGRAASSCRSPRSMGGPTPGARDGRDARGAAGRRRAAKSRRRRCRSTRRRRSPRAGPRRRSAARPARRGWPAATAWATCRLPRRDRGLTRHPRDRVSAPRSSTYLAPRPALMTCCDQTRCRRRAPRRANRRRPKRKRPR